MSISKKEAYQKKMDAELELAQAKLAEFKAQARLAMADVRIKYSKQVEHLEQGLGATKLKLKELGEASEDTWEKLKGGVESAWSSLSTSVRDTAAKF